MISGSFKNIINKMCLQIIYLKCMYKENLALNNLQVLVCHKTKPKQTKRRAMGNMEHPFILGTLWPRLEVPVSLNSTIQSFTKD